MTFEDQRSKKFVFLPFCVICQAFQAKGLVKYGWPGMMKPIVEVLMEQDVNVIQMPCPESCYGGYEAGLKRQPKGINEYDTTSFRELCDELASSMMDVIRALLTSGYQIVTILGIERSPSCAVNYQYTNIGMIHRQGIFIESLRRMLEKENLEIPFVGIEKKKIEKSVQKIRELCIRTDR